jgi:hypothetical protein
MVIGIDNLSLCPNVQSRIQVVCIVLPVVREVRVGFHAAVVVPAVYGLDCTLKNKTLPQYKQARTPLFPAVRMPRACLSPRGEKPRRSTPLDPCSTPNIRPATCHVGLRHRPYTHICDPNMAAFHPNATPHSHVPSTNDQFANLSNDPTFGYAIQTADTATSATIRCQLSCSTGGTNSLVFRVGPPK